MLIEILFIGQILCMILPTKQNAALWDLRLITVSLSTKKDKQNCTTKISVFVLQSQPLRKKILAHTHFALNGKRNPERTLKITYQQQQPIPWRPGRLAK